MTHHNKILDDGGGYGCNATADSSSEPSVSSTGDSVLIIQIKAGGVGEQYCIYNYDSG